MVDSATREALTHIGLRVRVGIALACVERMIAQHSIADDRVEELVEALWAFAEVPDDGEADERWRNTQAADDLLEAIDKGNSLPDSYQHVPRYIARALYDTLWSITVYVNNYLHDGGEESHFMIVRVLDLCTQHGVPLPSIEHFSHLSIDEDEGWGRTMPRSFFREALAPGTNKHEP
jgi:hypothetical protein